MKNAFRVNYTRIFILIIPLSLSAFTHIWNPVGFPAMYDDEDTYIKRAVLLLNGQGPKDPDYGYDHPYFGQVFLAGVLKLIGYTDSLDSTIVGSYSNVEHSIELLYLFPRILMGILAVVDTFLVYKISDRRYGRNVAFIASILFAVMPMTWFFEENSFRLHTTTPPPILYIICSLL